MPNENVTLGVEIIMRTT